MMLYCYICNKNLKTEWKILNANHFWTLWVPIRKCMSYFFISSTVWSYDLCTRLFKKSKNCGAAFRKLKFLQSIKKCSIYYRKNDNSGLLLHCQETETWNYALTPCSFLGSLGNTVHMERPSNTARYKIPVKIQKWVSRYELYQQVVSFFFYFYCVGAFWKM